MSSPGLIRGFGLFLPIVAVWGLWQWRRPDRRWAGAALLACAWNVAALPLLHILASRFSWWGFAARGGLYLGMPVDLYWGWVLLWGAIPVLTFPRLLLPLVVAVMFSIDLLLMPASDPVVRLGPRWIQGEMVGLALCLLPAQMLARWTIVDRHLRGRVLLQMAAFAGLILGVLPAALIENTGGGWRPLLERPLWMTGIGLQLMALPAILGLSAVQEFAARGGGTPFPYDPPKRLVTTGVYAYLANPMQVAAMLLLTMWGVLLSAGWVVAAGFTAGVYGLGWAALDEGEDLPQRFGRAWGDYRSAVPRWFPRWRPWYAGMSGGEHRPPVARLYLAASRAPCSQLTRWLQRRRPTGLILMAAEDHPLRDLYRLTYDPGTGDREEEGVAALARGLEHLHLGWAFVGWIIRLPLVRQFIQLVTDAVGGGPRRIGRRVLAQENSRA